MQSQRKETSLSFDPDMLVSLALVGNRAESLTSPVQAENPNICQVTPNTISSVLARIHCSKANFAANTEPYMPPRLEVDAWSSPGIHLAITICVLSLPISFAATTPADAMDYFEGVCHMPK